MSKPKILVIDDDPQFSALVQLNLGQSGDYEVVIQTDSTKAMKLAREFKPDLVILDIVMPGLDGGDIENLFRADPDLCKVPIIIMSAIVERIPQGWMRDDRIVRTKSTPPEEIRELIEQLLA